MGRELQRDLSNQLSTQQNYDPQGRLQQQRTIKSTQAQSPNQTQASIINQRSYQYNALGQLAQIDDQRRGSTQYHYDRLDRLTKVEGPNPESFVHDPAGNILSTNSDAPAQQRQPTNQVRGNRLAFQGDTHYRYDTQGNRIAQARGKDQKIRTDYRYNALNQLTDVKNNDKQTAYAYDPLGRRITKADKDNRTDFLWFEDVLLSESSYATEAGAEHAKQEKLYLFEPGTFKPLAFVQDKQVYHYHLDHLGTPQEISDAQGNIVWAVSYKAYGNLALAFEQSIENNLRFQGQYFDVESGLHYNRFRYYDPGCGRFVNQDPIGLLGGFNNYNYAPNPVHWIDPFGLSAKDCPPEKNKKTTYEGESRRDALREAKRDAGVPNSQAPEVKRVDLLDGDGKKLLDDKGLPVQAREFHHTNTDGTPVVIQEHSLGHAKATPKHGLEPHFNVRQVDPNTGKVLNTSSFPGAHGHYNF